MSWEREICLFRIHLRIIKNYPIIAAISRFQFSPDSSDWAQKCIQTPVLVNQGKPENWVQLPESGRNWKYPNVAHIIDQSDVTQVKLVSTIQMWIMSGKYPTNITEHSRVVFWPVFTECRCCLDVKLQNTPVVQDSNRTQPFLIC